MNSRYVTVQVSDGTAMPCYVVQPEGGDPSPGLLLFQEAFGVNAHIRDVADRLATEGYTVIAPELFHRTAEHFEGDYNNFGGAMPHVQAMTIEGQSVDIQAAYEWLVSQEQVAVQKIGAIGFCLGGTMAFLANVLLPISAAVSYYGIRIMNHLELSQLLHAPMLFYWGGLDKQYTPEVSSTITGSLQEAGKEYTNVVISNADHAFNCDRRAAYNPQAAKEAWAMTLAFLENRLTG